MEVGEHLYDQEKNIVKVLDEEYHNVCASNSLSSKGVFKLIQKQGSFRHIMALVNTGGYVAKEWPIEIVDGNCKLVPNYGSNVCVGSPMYRPLHIGKEKHVNLQFRNFGINISPNDTYSVSHASRIDGNEANSHYCSLSNSPRHSNGLAKDINEEFPIPRRVDEEPNEVSPIGSEDELNDSSVKQEEELEGSVDEESTKV